MPDPTDWIKYQAQFKEAQAKIMNLFGENPPPEMAEEIEAFQKKMPEMMAQAEANMKKAQEMEAEQINYLKRLRGEEVESDKEKEGDLDLVPDSFEKEHGLKPEKVQEFIQILLGVVGMKVPDSSGGGATGKTAAAPVAIDAGETPNLTSVGEIIADMKRRGLLR